MSIYPVQTQSFQIIGSGATAGGTTFTLQSFKDILGTNLAMASFGALGFGTIEPNTSNEDSITFTGITQNSDGTATLTGVNSVLFITPYTTGSGLRLSHAGSVTFIITNTSAFYNTFANKNNDETITGQWTFDNFPITPSNSDASTTVKGVTKLSVAPSSASNPIAVGTNDTRVPTADPTTLFAPISVVIPTGAISMYGGSAAPTGYLLCDGTSYLRSDYTALFAILSTTYGSADGTHFNVPDLRGRVPVGVGTGTGGGAAGTGAPTGGTALTAVARAGWKGEETHVLTVGELAAHTHSFSTISSSGSDTGGNPRTATGSDATLTTSSTGSNTAHNNIQPVMGVNFIIKT